MSDTYNARPSQIVNKTFSNGKRFEEVSVHRAMKSGNDQWYLARRLEGTKEWQVFNKKTLVSLNPDSKIYQGVVEAAEGLKS